MASYEHRQAGTWLWIPIAMGGLGALAGAVVLFPREPLVAAVCLLSGLLVLGVGYLFRHLTVRVGPKDLEVAFGSGWPRRRLPLAELASAERVRNRWWYGWGIRYTPHGWLWNIAGLDAVEVRRRDGRGWRIGTDDPEGLLRALREAIGAR